MTRPDACEACLIFVPMTGAVCGYWVCRDCANRGNMTDTFFLWLEMRRVRAAMEYCGMAPK